MRFNPRARLDRGQVQNRRGSGGGYSTRSGGGRLPGGGVTVGGGIGGLIVLVVFWFLSGGNLGGLTEPGAGPEGSRFEHCRTGADANEDPDCARVAIVNSIHGFWSEALPEQSDRPYRPADTVVFSGGVSTACGSAGSDVGPFYCPADQQVYLDTTFFEDMLEGRLGARGGDFAEAYVLAHEYGHHVQNLLGTMGRVRTQQGPDSDAVRLELQADCYAGMWTRHATEVPDANGEVLLAELTEEDVEEALDAARAVGDDRIQERSSGRVNPDAWTHGSAEQRIAWFTRGMREGSLRACDTFAASRL